MTKWCWVSKTTIDKEHIHNHIYYNSTAYDRSRKFRNFIGSSFALRRLSDRVCLEHDLSVIVNPKLHSKGRYLHYGQWLGENQKLSQKEQIRLAIDAALTERPADFADFLRRMETAGIQVKHGRGGVISFLVPGQQRAARFRASTLGDGYGPEDVQAVIDGKAPTRKAPVRRTPAPRRVNLLIDIQERMRQGKGPAYERWAKVYNLKQMAAALQYLKEHQLSPSLKLVLQGFQMLHVHVFLAAPLGSGYMTQPGTDQHQCRISIREGTDYSCPAPDLPVHPLDDIVGPDLHPMLRGEVTVSGQISDP